MLSKDSEAELPVYAIMVKFRHEKNVALALAGKGYKQYVPLQRVTRHYRGHNRVVEIPLFPTYVFARFDAEFRLPILTIPGVFGIVGNSHHPLPIDEREFESIMGLCRSGLETKEAVYGEPGDQILVMEGPLAGVVGTLVANKGCCRLVVSITILSRAVAVELDASSVYRLASDGGRPVHSSLPERVITRVA